MKTSTPCRSSFRLRPKPQPTSSATRYDWSAPRICAELFFANNQGDFAQRLQR